MSSQLRSPTPKPGAADKASQPASNGHAAAAALSARPEGSDPYAVMGGSGNSGQIQALRASASRHNNMLQSVRVAQFNAGIVRQMEEVHFNRSDQSGLWYAEDYRSEHPRHWHKQFETGHADPVEFRRNGPMDWSIRERQSASQALQRWIAGTTIAESGTGLVAMHLDAVRREIGNAKFDECFGAEDGRVPKIIPLRINSIHEDCMPTALLRLTGSDPRTGQPVLVPGAKYQLVNHADYLFRHPAGIAQAFSVLYAGPDIDGGPLWMGVGVFKMTTREVLHLLGQAYNEPRTAADYLSIVQNPANSVEQEWVRKSLKQGHTAESIYRICAENNLIDPFFTGADAPLPPNQLHAGAFAPHLESQGLMLNLHSIDRLKVELR